MSVPGTIDAAWLEAALRAGACPAARVRSVSAEVIGVGFGLDGTLARLTLDADDAPRTLVAKWCGAAAGGVETRFYRTIAPRLPVALARLYASATDDVAARALLLLEDVAPAKQGDVLVGATAAESEALADAMAGFHAAFWDQADDAALAPLPLWTATAPALVARLPDVLPRFLREWQGRLPPAALAVAADLPARAAAACAELAAAPPTLVHADLHLDNVLFRPDGTPVVLDWTDAVRGPAAADVARLIECMTTDARRARGGALLARHARALAARGVVGYGEERLARDVERVLVHLYAAAALWSAGPDPLVPAPRVPLIVESLVRNVASAVVEGFA